MPSPALPIALILACALLGAYAALFTSHRDGFLDALRVCTSPLDPKPSAPKCILRVPQPYRARLGTGLPAVDGPLAVLFEFFGQGLTSDGGSSARGLEAEALLAVSYLAAQFGGVWYLLALEGLRRGHVGSVLSWTGTFGMVAQLVTITIVAPIYLTLQLLFSPQLPAPDAIAIDVLDLGLLPASFTIAFILPTIGLALSLLNILSPVAKYFAIAIWQPFPLYQSAIQAGLRFVFGRRRRAPQPGAPGSRKALGKAYAFVLSLTIGTHLLVLGAIVLAAWTDVTPLSASEILSPGSLADPPTLALRNPPVSAAAARAIVVSFLRWDVYCACTALVVWAAYLARSAGTAGFPVIVAKVVFWALIGGPVTPAAMLLWQRDVQVSAKAEIKTSLEDEKAARMTRRAFRSLDH